MIFLSSPVQGIAADLAHPELNRIKTKELKQLTDNKSEFILIDSRDSGKYSQGHIKGAINISFNPSGDPNALKMTLMALPIDRLIIVYCDSEGEKISAGLAMDLYDMGCDMDNLKILSGGMAQWKKMGYPLIKAGE
jgi:rhodanese-related sulfurtransferase